MTRRQLPASVVLAYLQKQPGTVSQIATALGRNRKRVHEVLCGLRAQRIVVRFVGPGTGRPHVYRLAGTPRPHVQLPVVGRVSSEVLRLLRTGPRTTTELRKRTGFGKSSVLYALRALHERRLAIELQPPTSNTPGVWRATP